MKFMEIRTIISLDAPVLLVSKAIQNSQFRVLLHIILVSNGLVRVDVLGLKINSRHRKRKEVKTF